MFYDSSVEIEMANGFAVEMLFPKDKEKRCKTKKTKRL